MPWICLYQAYMYVARDPYSGMPVYICVQNIIIMNNFVSGIGLLHFHMYHVIDHRRKDRYLKRALYYLEEPLENLKRKKHSFLCGDPGPLALGAVIYEKLGKKDESKECLKRFLLIRLIILQFK